MTIWNIRLGRRQLNIKVKRILHKEPEFMVIIDSRKRRHKLSRLDFFSSEWEKIGVDSTITLIITESVTSRKIQLLEIKKNLQKFIVEIKEKASGPFFIWNCQYCGTEGFIEYETGDDLQIIAERIVRAHGKEIKAGCKKDIRIFDHRGMEQKDSALFLASRRVE